VKFFKNMLSIFGCNHNYAWPHTHCDESTGHFQITTRVCVDCGHERLWNKNEWRWLTRKEAKTHAHLVNRPVLV